jgi:hypothetical protein
MGFQIRHLYWILTGPSFAVHIRYAITEWNRYAKYECGSETLFFAPKANFLSSYFKIGVFTVYTAHGKLSRAFTSIFLKKRRFIRNGCILFI